MTQIFPGSMKKIISILGVISLFAACTAELDTTPEITEEQALITKEAPVLYASIEEGAETKVYLDENYKVLWHADDRISVFNKDTYNLQYRFDGNTGDNSGTFSEVPDGLLHTSNDIENLYAVYPYNASTSISNTSVLTVNYPDAQTYSADSFGRGANTMVAVTDGNNLQFKNACGYLMFKLYGTGVKVKSIILRGNDNEKIAGEATITMSLGGTPTVSMSGSATEEIVLTCTDAVTIGTTSETYTEFWFAIPPVTFTNGITIRVIDEKGNAFGKSTSSPLEIVRSYAKKMAPLSVQTIPDVVDLGLSVKWAAWDLGAVAPEDFGDYFAWGEIAPKDEYSWATYAWCNGSENSLTKYNKGNSYGVVDNKSVLDAEDDAARAYLGSEWRMPTYDEYQELIANCTMESYASLNGVPGLRLTSKKEGYTDKSIFFPITGVMDGQELVLTTDGCFWGNVVGSPKDNPYLACVLQITNHSIGTQQKSRYRGCPIRAVKP